MQFATTSVFSLADAAVFAASQQAANAERCLQFFASAEAATVFTQVGVEQAEAAVGA